MSVQEAADLSRSKSNQIGPSNNNMKSTSDKEILPNSEDTLDSDINIYITLERHTQNLLAKTGVKGLDIDFNGQPSILIFVKDKKHATNLPTKLDGFPVEIIEGEACFV